MDVRGVELSHAIVGGAEIASAPIPRAGSSQTRQAATENSKVRPEEMTHIMQDQLDGMNVSLKYFTYEGSGERIAIAVVNTITGEVVREIPTKELRALYAKMNELVGMILNKQV
jgi:uncharacterized FlaG/YvyC family protein